MTSSRQEALRELERIEQGGAFIGLSRRPTASKTEHDGKLADLVAGVTRRRRWLDFLVDQFYQGDPALLEPKVRIILRMGLYELLHTRTPDHAVVNEMVDCAKAEVGKRVTGLVNGILRRTIREKNRLPVPMGTGPVDALAIAHSHPTWMVERWIDRFGEAKTIALLEHNNERPRFGIRLRTQQSTQHRSGLLEEMGVDGAQESPFFEDFIRSTRLSPFFKKELVQDGTLLIQDEAAGGVVRVMDPQPGERILDACAAPGGKAIYMADRVGSTGLILGVDKNKSRVRLLESEAARLNLPQVETRVVDLRECSESEFGEPYDKVLLDAPCSGLGVLSKRADLRWRTSPEQILQLSRLQDALLDSVARFVKPGGILVYGTCTLEPEENEDRIGAFLDRNSAFTIESAADYVPNAMVNAEGFYRTLPFEHEIDGVFAVRMRKSN
ncbi:MAG: 16S rRNA (cytosine(967)-C(5))-methyltransferase RsmB [Bacteroidetes bacterium]|nr:MAG: 16S rRNA (cytosine(967)-C(5))-methyltransferase RsmB [Bacteroidota bacterium]